MKKLIFVGLIFVYLMNINTCKSQTKWYDREFIRIEMENGPFHSIRFLKEGLLCKTVDTNYMSIIEFFPKAKLDFNKIGKLEDYLYSESLLMKDTIVDNPSTVISGNYNGLRISIINNNNLYFSYWVDGDCKYLEKCLFLLNDLIPIEKKELFKIRFNH